MMSPPAGSHFLPSGPSPMSTNPRMVGILLNASPSSSAPNSPKRLYLTPYSSSRPSSSHAANGAGGPPSFSSHSSSASSTSSSDDIASSSATEATPSSSSGRKIRFAPLPDPRRDVLVAEDGSEVPVPSVFADEACTDPDHAHHAHTTGAGCTCQTNGTGLSSPLASPFFPPTTPTSAGSVVSFSSQMLPGHSGASCSTLGLSFDGGTSYDGPDSGHNTETNTVIGSECSSLNEQQSGKPSKRNRLARLLRLPKSGPLKLNSSNLSPDCYPGFSASNLFRPNSRESTASNYSARGSMSDSYSDTASMRRFATRRTNSVASADGAAQRAAFRSGWPLKAVISEAGTSSTASSAQKKAKPLPAASVNGTRRGTRLLNGRVYGVKQSAALAAQMRTNPFGNARDEEPEFVEWGHGGMGSVRSGAVAGAKSDYSRLQSSKKLSVGAVDGEGQPDEADEDDGSGLAWVKKRKAQKEKERLEAQEREKAEKDAKGKERAVEGAADDKGNPEDKNEQVVNANPDIRISPASPGPATAEKTDAVEKEVPGPVTPKDASEDKELRQPEDASAAVEAKDEKKEEGKEPEHIYTAITLPPKVHHHRPHHAHTNSHASMATTGSATPTQEHVFALHGNGPSPLGRSAEPESRRSSMSSSPSNSDEDEENGGKDGEDDEVVEKDVGEEDEDEEDEEDVRHCLLLSFATFY